MVAVIFYWRDIVTCSVCLFVCLCVGLFVSVCLSVCLSPELLNNNVTKPSVATNMWQSQAQVSDFTWLYNIEILAEEAEYNLFHNSCSENHCLVTSTRLMKSKALWGYVQEGTILHFPSLNTISIRRILLREPCTHLECVLLVCRTLFHNFLNVLMF